MNWVMAMATNLEALIRLYNALNHPSKAGPKWVTYERDVVDSAIDVLKQLAISHGAETVKFVPDDALSPEGEHK